MKVYFFALVLVFVSKTNPINAEVCDKDQDVIEIIKLLERYDSLYFENKDSFETGEALLNKCLNLAKKSNFEEGILKVTYRIGKNYHRIHKNDVKAVKCLFEALKLAEKTNNQEYLCKTYNFLGIIFQANHKYDDALQYYNASIKSPWNNDTLFKGIPLYLSGLCHYELKNYDKALICFKSSLNLTSTNNANRVNEIKMGISRVLVATKHPKEAKIILLEALNFYNKKTIPEAVAVGYYLLSEIYLLDNRLDSALKYANLAYVNSEQSNLPTNQIEIEMLLHDIYSRKSNVKEAYRYLLKVQKTKDKISALDITSQIALSQAQYKNEIERKQLNETITRQKRENRIALIAAGVLGGLFLIIGFLLMFVRKERQKSEALIHNILPAKTVQQLKTFGKAIPTRHDAVSVMFCDVKDFSQLASTLEPENLISILDFYFSHFDRIIRSYHNIEKIKTIGDAYLCVSGLSSNDQHASDMVEAAYEIVQFVRASKEEVKEKFGQNIEFRVGIHSGSLVSGVVGTHKYAYDVWGETVNIAARLEGASEPGKINISQATYEAIQTKFRCEKRGIIEVKNGLKLEMYFVVSPA